MISAHLEVFRGNNWSYVATLHHWSTKIPALLYQYDAEDFISKKGLPNDVADLTAMYVSDDTRNGEFSSPNWMSSNELKEWLENFGTDSEFENWLLCCEGFEKVYLKVRIVFWMQAWT
jgi:hypothetical protein